LNVHNVSDARHTEIYITEPLVPRIAKLKKYKLPGSAQILTELIQARERTLSPETYELINSVWNKEELPGQW
jgi:hypothetical protein